MSLVISVLAGLGGSGSVSDEDVRRHRDYIEQAIHQASLEFDKAILAIAGSSLALSVSFMASRGRDARFIEVPVLGLAWVFLATSMICIVVSFLSSQAALRRILVEIEDDKPLEAWKGLASRTTAVLNCLAILCLVLGLGTLGWFAYVNVG
jgi:hypothetical protein